MNKLLLLLGVCMLFCSCATQKYSQTTYIADYRSYSAEGFTISPSSSGFTYESVADFSIKFVVGKKKGYTNSSAQNSWEADIFNPGYDYMVSEMVKEAKSLGANAILNFRINIISGGYEASGFAVKLKK